MILYIGGCGFSPRFGRHVESEFDKDYLPGFHLGDIMVVPYIC